MENTFQFNFRSPSPPLFPLHTAEGGRAWRKKDGHKPGSKREARRRLNYTGRLSPFLAFGYVALPPRRRNSNEVGEKDGSLLPMRRGRK